AKNGAAATDIEALRALHKAIRQVTKDIEQLRYNTAISALMRTLTIFERHTVTAGEFLTFLKLLAPFAPYLAEELWREQLQQQGSIHHAPWPSYREELVREEKVKVVVQVDGRVRAVLEVAPGLPEEEMLRRALAEEKIRARVTNGKPARVIYVQDKILNLLTKAGS
ncbi:leucine--tRNA ligase, partial [Candidatus Parcubacteria bacterium]